MAPRARNNKASPRPKAEEGVSGEKGAPRKRKADTGALLAKYHAKRNFSKTAEPRGADAAQPTGAGLTYMIQKHAATRLHYDFRLEMDGVLKSWAVTRGPSLNPSDKRLAVHVEDHPLEYATFEGTIPPGEYGGGTVMLWDRGAWEPLGDMHAEYAKGHLRFRLHGERLQGEWHLVRMHGHRKDDDRRENWLLIKSDDAAADAKDGDRLLKKADTGIASGLRMEAIARQGMPHAASAIPLAKKHRTGEKARTAPSGRSPTTRAARVPARAAASPSFEPQLATLVGVPPGGNEWLHEIKFDGYRLLAQIHAGEIRLITRNGNDWTAKFPGIVASLRKIKARHVLLDGELVALEPDGRMTFSALQKAIKQTKSAPLRYYLFDLLHLEGENTAALPLEQRKRALAAIMPRKSECLYYSDDFPQTGREVLAQACGMGMEGIVSKRRDMPYRPGRGYDWVKSKCLMEQEFVIGGYTLQPDHPGVLGAMLIGYYEGDRLQFAGKVGTGYTQEEARALMAQFKKREQKNNPFAKVPTPSRRGAHWLRPELVAQVRFTEWTEDGALRHPSLQGLREDKPARDVVREKAKALPMPYAIRPEKEAKTPRPKPGPPTSAFPTSASPKPATLKSAIRTVPALELQEDEVEIHITHPDKVVFAEGTITKGEVALYYQQVAPWMLVHLAGRPVSMLRCPDGAGTACFFQRHAGSGASPHWHAVTVPGSGEDEPYVYIKDEAGLLSLVQMGVLEFHAWGAPAAAPDRPDRLTFDFDPDGAVPWPHVKAAATRMRALLEQLGLRSFLKTTGGKGLHVVAPIEAGPDWDRVKHFTQAISEIMAQEDPAAYTTNIRKAKRTGRIFIDYMRNDLGATAIAPYSTRARSGAPMAMPIAWEELETLKSGAQFTLRNAGDYLKKRKTDPWAELPDLHQKLPKF